jgi:hypothetical protein
MKWSEDKINILKDNYSKFGSKYCSELLNVKVHSIHNMAKKLNLKIDKNIKSEILSKSKSVVNINFDVFIKLNKPEIIYFLGLFWADGYMYQTKNGYNSSIGIGLVEEDMIELEFHLDKIGVWNKRVVSKKKNSSWRQTKSILTNNKRIYNFLVDMDFKDKSFKSADKILTMVPENLKHYFFRGLIDGDGCFYVKTKINNRTVKQFTLSSSINQDWGYFISLLGELNVKKYGINKNTGSNIRVTNKEGIVKIGEYIYQNYENDRIGLSRKYSKYLCIKNS